MKKLIRVVRSRYTPDVNLGQGEVRFHRMPQAILSVEVDMDKTDFTNEGEFFLVEHNDVENTMRVLAENNPGHEVQVYNLEQSAQCPAAPMVVKKITAEGVLPA